ncbi:MAG TPA: CPBP family intramembrane glutamic endopeptidase [Solimonas sp.]
MTDVWTLPEWRTALAFAGISLIYPVYHYALQAPQWRARFAHRYGGDRLEIASVLAQRYAGGLWMALASLAMALAVGLSPAALGLGLGDPLRSLGWLLAVALPLLPLIARGAAQPKRWGMYPQMRLQQWSRRRQGLNALAWGGYLLGYEIFFRGLCLVWLTQQFGFWPGILASSALYAYAHLHKDAGETFGSVAMGIVFALMTLHSGSIWAAVILHWLMGVAGEQSAILRNPALRRG